MRNTAIPHPAAGVHVVVCVSGLRIAALEFLYCCTYYRRERYVLISNFHSSILNCLWQR
jgi:hypothetical protein